MLRRSVMCVDNGQGGYILVVVAFTLVLLLGFAALAVDVGVMYAAHTSAQRAADAAALAGAYTFIESPDADDPVAVATTSATDTATQNTILGAFIQSSEVAVNVTYSNTDRLVQVNIDHTVPTFFAGVLGPKFANVAVVAYAEGSIPSGKGIKPWFIPNNVLSPLGCGACSSSPHQLIIQGPYPDTHVTVWAKDYIKSQTLPGQDAFRVKPGNPSNALGPGEFFAIQLSNDSSQSGGDAYRENIAYYYPWSVSCGDSYSVKTGNMIGPTMQGTEVLLTPTPDAWNGIAQSGPHKYSPQYLSPSNQLLFDSHQVVLAPVWDVCATICDPSVCPGPSCDKLAGTNVQIQIVGFAKLFISEIQGNDVMAYLVGAYDCNSSNTGAPSAPSLPLRLVRIN